MLYAMNSFSNWCLLAVFISVAATASIKYVFLLSFLCSDSFVLSLPESNVAYLESRGLSDYVHRVKTMKSMIHSLGKPPLQNFLDLSREKWTEFGNLLGIANLDKDWKAQKVIEHDVVMYQKCFGLHKRNGESHESTLQSIFHDTCESTPYLGHMIGILQLLSGNDHGWQTMRASSRAHLINTYAEKNAAAGLAAGLVFDGVITLFDTATSGSFTPSGIIITVLEKALKDSVDLNDLRRIISQSFQDVMPVYVHNFFGHNHHHHHDPQYFSAYALDKNPLKQTVKLAVDQAVHTAIHYMSHLIAGHVAAATGLTLGHAATAGAIGIYGTKLSTIAPALLPAALLAFSVKNDYDRKAEFKTPIPSFTCSDAAVPLLEDFNEQAALWEFEKNMIIQYEAYRSKVDEEWEKMITEHFEKFLKVRVYKDCKGPTNYDYPYELYKKRIIIARGSGRMETKRYLADKFSSALINCLLVDKKKVVEEGHAAIDQIVNLVGKLDIVTEEVKEEVQGAILENLESLRTTLHEFLEKKLEKIKAFLTDENTARSLYNQFVSALDGMDKVIDEPEYAALVKKRPAETVPRLIESLRAAEESEKRKYIDQRTSQAGILSDAEVEHGFLEFFNKTEKSESLLMKTVELNLEKGIDEYGNCRTCRNKRTKLDRRTILALECYFLEKSFRKQMGLNNN